MSATLIYGAILAFLQDKISKKIVEKIKKKKKNKDKDTEGKEKDEAT